MAASVVVDRQREAAIFSRVVDRSLSSFSPETARSILDLGFGEEDHARVHELTERNQYETLAAAEKDELMNFVKVGNLLAILQSKARKVLKDPAAGCRQESTRFDRSGMKAGVSAELDASRPSAVKSGF